MVLVTLALGTGLGAFIPEVPRAIHGALKSLGLSWTKRLQAQEPALRIQRDEAIGAKNGGHGDKAVANRGETAGLIEMPAERIEATRIEIASTGPGTLARRISVPGTVAADADRLVIVAAKVAGTITELRKRLGDTVAPGELIAVLSSREVADAKTEYLAASLTLDLQKTMFERERLLWDKRITSEAQFLKAKAALDEAQIRVDVARQKLSALGLGEKEIVALRKEPVTGLRRQELGSPIAGRVVDRKVGLGAPVLAETELFLIADLSKVWVEMAVPPSDLPSIKEGQRIEITGGGTPTQVSGKIIFISPLLDPETRSARVVAEIDNKGQVLRPGTFVTAKIVVEEQRADLLVPRTALQTIGGEQVVFARTPVGFDKREIQTGRSDDQAVEVTFGLKSDEMIAVTNTFLLKAELGKPKSDD